MDKNTETLDIKNLLGRRIKEFRIKKGYTQEFLAEKIGIGQRNLSKIECGTNFVTSETLAKILMVLDVEAHELFKFNHNNDKEILKQELLKAISSDQIDIELMYKFYETIK
ncbi:helix-turn-helix transcriptional regulator [bacterium]|nr:helix-turn-helix transcriptional regulator [bacterium]